MRERFAHAIAGSGGEMLIAAPGDERERVVAGTRGNTAVAAVHWLAALGGTEVGDGADLPCFGDNNLLSSLPRISTPR